jgi:DNA-binding NtrC family response regulator
MAIGQAVEARGYSLSAASSLEQARAELDRCPPDLMLVGDSDDAEPMRRLVRRDGRLRAPVIVVDDQDPRRLAQRLPPPGPQSAGHAPTATTTHDKKESMLEELDTGSAPAMLPLIDSDRFAGLVGRSEQMHRICDTIVKVAPTDATVLIVGESGTGKERIAEAIHQRSPRRDRSFVVLNCGAIPDNLIDSELFGHEKGAFTGATRARSGVFERADGGTLFLDEITEMPIDLQTRLLRVLETGRVLRVGGEREIDVHCRVVAATNRSPLEAVEAGKLREDLFYRLSVFPIRVPALRRRCDDIEVLAEHFLSELNDQFEQTRRFSPQAMQMMKSFHWPGNVRQLRNAIHRAFILADDDVIHSGVIPRHESKARGSGGSAPGIALTIGTSIAEAENKLIRATLEHFGGNKKKTAKTLGVSLRTLYNRLNTFGFDTSDAQPDPAGDAPPPPEPESDEPRNGHDATA